MKKHRWTILFSLILLIFTTYTVLDTFVLASVYQQDAGGMNLSVFETVDDGEETDTGSSAGRETDPFSAAEEGKGAASASGEKKQTCLQIRKTVLCPDTKNVRTKRGRAITGRGTPESPGKRHRKAPSREKKVHLQAGTGSEKGR